MPNTVYDKEEIELSDGTVVELRPLTIKNLKKFTKAINRLQEIDTNDESIDFEEVSLDIFIEAGMVCMGQLKPEYAVDRDKFEDVIEVPTLMKILEVAGGLKLGNTPNPQAANPVGTN